MNCLIVDDDAACQLTVKMYLGAIGGFDRIDVLDSAIEAVEVLTNKTISYDILVLDVEMPGMSGLDLLALVPLDCKVIMISSKPEYAVDSYDFDVTRFVAKPLDSGKFNKAVERCKDLLEAEKVPAKASVPSDSNIFWIKDSSNHVPVDLADLCYIESYDNYLTFHGHRKKVVIHSTLQSVIEMLVPRFPNLVRIHRSYVVNMQTVSKVGGSYVEVTINGEIKELKVSRGYKSSLLESMNILNG